MEATPDRARFGHGWYPYLAPYVGFLLLVEIGNRLPESATGPMLLLKVAVPVGLLVTFARQGCYPEMRGYRLDVGSALDVLLGLAIAALWMAPFLLGWLPGPDPAEGFDPDVHGAAARPAVLGLRVLGFAAVTPFVEELFVRSFLPRLTDAYAYRRVSDFRDVPMAQYSRWSFAVVVLWFTFTHVSWEWPVAFLTCVIWNLWLYRRRHLVALVVSHAVANAAIFAAVVLAPADWWYFL